MLLKNLFCAAVPLIAKDGFGGELESSSEAISISQCKGEDWCGGGAYGVMVFLLVG